MSERSKPSIFWLFAIFALPIMGVMVKYRFHNPEKMPRSGAVVITPNHYSNIDPVVIGVATWYLGRLPRFMAKASILKVPVLGWILLKSGQIPVERGGSTRSSAALNAAKELVSKERAVIVYPEGSLTRDPDIWPMRGKSGAVRLALELGIPVIPIAHWGTQNLMARYSKKINVFPRHTIDVKVGDPVDLSEFQGKPLDNKTLTAATTKVMDAITALLEDLRGEKAPATRWNPAEHNQSETGRF
ncbi:lysophospholipid acyltransferase family protein [Aurantimicrobium minutum]|uniref:lysophospholipid acyltransferase family protein n=1 Tax=Aurantimicrobium minutum TaxID=708131 RepID=UPI00247BFFAB|nr:1-acyl-sn-glycerol-3-phosphate acyltransferase [Aurantimicrobium minutum]